MRPAALAQRLASLLSLGVLACSIEVGPPRGDRARAGGPTEVLVYTSMYQSVIDAFGPYLERALPDVKVSFYRAGSEKIALRLEAERKAGATSADLLLVSDPFYYQRLVDEGALLPYVSPHALRHPRETLDLDGHFTTARVSTMALVYNPAALGKTPPPRTYADLAEPRYQGKAAIPDPLMSGTSFVTIAFLAEKYGWGFFERLRRNGVADAGGNSAVLEKVERGEHALGLVCWENVVQVRRKGSPVIAVEPADGAITIPGHVAILRGSRNAEAARRVIDAMLAPEGQRLVVGGDMHSVDPRVGAPEGLPAFAELLARGQRWSPEFIVRTSRRAAEIKQTYERVMRR